MDRPTEPVTIACAQCGNDFINRRPWVQRRYCSHACQCAAYRDKHYIKRKTPLKGKPVIPVKPWEGPLCFCGMPGRYEGKCGHHNFSRRYNIRKRNALIKKFIGDVDAGTLKLAILNYGSLESMIGSAWKREETLLAQAFYSQDYGTHL